MDQGGRPVRPISDIAVVICRIEAVVADAGTLCLVGIDKWRLVGALRACKDRSLECLQVTHSLIRCRVAQRTEQVGRSVRVGSMEWDFVLTND